MNGLEYVRKLCNISQGDLAEILNISKQAISMWENGKREISKIRIQELAVYFGLDEMYFGDISDNQIDELRFKPKFRHYHKDKEIYLFRPKEGATSFKQGDAFFYSETEKSLDELYREALDMKKDMLEKIDEYITGKPCNLTIDRINYIRRRSTYYDFINRFIEKKESQRVELKMAYSYEMLNALLALELAFDDSDEVRNRIDKNCNESPVYGCDKEYIYSHAEEIRRRWENKIATTEEYRISAKESTKKIQKETSKEEVVTNPSVKEQFEEAEEFYRKLVEEFEDVIYFPINIE